MFKIKKYLIYTKIQNRMIKSIIITVKNEETIIARKIIKYIITVIKKIIIIIMMILRITFCNHTEI